MLANRASLTKKERKTDLVRSRTPQLEPARLPSAHPPVGPHTDHDRHTRSRRGRAAASVDSRDLVERDLLDRRALLVPFHLGEDRPLDEVDGAETAFCAADDGDGRSRVDGEAVDAAFEAEPGVLSGQFVDRFACSRVPQDEHRVFRGGHDLFACQQAVAE